MKVHVGILPIWRLTISDKLYYYLLGTTKKSALETLKNNDEDVLFENFTIEPVPTEDAKNILLQVDLENEDEFTTLFEEARYYSEHQLEREFFLASSFDVVADYSLKYAANPLD